MNDIVLGIIVAAIAIAVAVAWWLRSRRALPTAPDAEPTELPPAERKTVELSQRDREAVLVVPPAERKTIELPTGERAPSVPEPAAQAPVERPRELPRAPVFAPPPSLAPMPVERPTTARLERSSADDERAAARRAERALVRAGLAKTRGGFVAKLARLLAGKPKVDADLKDRIEEVLFTADIGTSTAERLTKKVTELLDKAQVGDADSVWAVIEQAALEIVDIPATPTDFTPSIRPYVLLAIGVNGVGKTTTLGKLAAQHLRAGRKVLLVAGDTFRAGAVDQLDVWARKVGAAIHTGDAKADPSSVIYDGILRGRKEGFDVVLCDTAGRLHTRKELMDELGKVRRAAAKALAHDLRDADRNSGPKGREDNPGPKGREDNPGPKGREDNPGPKGRDDNPGPKGREDNPGPKGREDNPVTGPHDTYLVLDATIGQNALAQAKLFKETTDFSGLVVTKLDGTAKGGVVLGVCDELRIPIRYVGIGEGVEDLRPFDAEDFVAALLSDRDRAGEDAA